MPDSAGSFLLAGLMHEPSLQLQVVAVRPGSIVGPYTVAITEPLGATISGGELFDQVLVLLPDGREVLPALDWCRRRLTPTGHLHANASALAAAAMDDCYPAHSAEVTLGAAGFTPDAAPSPTHANLWKCIPTNELRLWRERMEIKSTASADDFMTARPAPPISFVTPSIDDATLEGNLLRSRAVRSASNELLIERRGPQVQAALNAGVARAAYDLIVVVHEDVYLPPMWEGMFRRSLRLVESSDREWGVVGCAGVRRRFGLLRVRRRGVGHARENTTTWGRSFDAPEPVETLDEFLIAFRRDRGFHFDESQPNYHFYGVDLCLQAAAGGRRCYAIEAFCYHNARPRQDRRAAPLPDFLAGCDYMRRKWHDRLPILTTCTVIERTPDHDHHARRVRRAARRGAV